MKRNTFSKNKSLFLCMLAIFAIWGCSNDDPPGGTIDGTDTGTSGDTDTDSDSDTDIDGDSDGDADSDTDADTDTDTDADGDTDDGGIDNSCDDDLACPGSQFCEAGECTDDICAPGTSHCEELDIVQCDSNGGGWSHLYTCGSDAIFESICVDLTPILAVCMCEDDWDCPEHTVCNVDACEGTGVEPTCLLDPEPFENMLPTLEIEWGGVDQANPNAVDSPFPESAQTVMTPLVANLNDDNGDGLINELDFPEIIFTTFQDRSFQNNGVLRAIHGGGANKGKDFFAVCNETIWHEGDDLTMACNYEDADLNSTAALAVGDLDYDGVPEIVAMLEGANGGIAIFSNTGEPIFKSAALNMNYQNAGPSLANIDNDGLVEIIIGRHVFKLFKDEADENKLKIQDEFEGTNAHGLHGQGPVTCVANIEGDAKLEIIAGTSVYRLPSPPADVSVQADCQGPYTEPDHIAFCAGELVTIWDGKTVNPDIPSSDGFCAVADVLGADQEAAPGPDNPLDDVAEVITISSGHLYVFNGQTGELRRDINVTGKGGAPNVDDFDGDGFPEVGAAFETKYAMIDLQAPTEDCPEWPIAFEDDVDGLQGNPERIGDCLHNGWARLTQDASSKVTGSSVFDFNGDGAAEVVYNDECFFRIYDGTTGQVLFKENSPSRTRIEYPIVADVDNDGNAEIVFCASNESNFCEQNGGPEGGDNYNNGLEVWGDNNDLWVSARRIWNQHAYHVTNVTEGGRIPIYEPESWLNFGNREYNIYRSNPRSFGVAPDFVLTGVQVSSPDASCGELSELLDITVRVENIGDLRVGPGVVLSYFGQWTQQGLSEPLFTNDGTTPLEYILTSSMEPASALLATVNYNAANNSPGVLPDTIRVVVDFYDQERECDEDNNDIESEVNAGELQADLVIDLGAANGDECPNPTVETTVTNEGSAIAENILVRYFAGDPNAGGSVLHEKTLADPLGPGESISFTEIIPDFPDFQTIWIWAIVDPDNTVSECNDGNNTDMADNDIQCGTIID